MIEFRNVSKSFGKGMATLEDLNFHIDKGSFVFLIGPTGAGKTTIFRLIIKEYEPTKGSIVVGDWELGKLKKGKIPELRRKVSVIFQDLKLLMDRTALENVMLPLQFTGVPDSKAKAKAEEYLMQVGLNDKGNKFPLQLSGGERQRVAIARALIFDPEIILADEPTGNLDMETSFQIIDLLESINKKGTTIFMATHNEKIVEKSNLRTLHIKGGKLEKDTEAEELKKTIQKSKKEEDKDES